MSAPAPDPAPVWRFLVILGLAIFLTVIVRTAWLGDDSYITFRTVDNFIHGHGFRWNGDERAQAYTHPLWMLLLTLLALPTRDVYYPTLFLSLACSLGAVLLVTRRVARSSTAAIFVLAALISSKAFTDYCTSGLENPLTHLLAAAFLTLFLLGEDGDRRTRALGLCAGLAAVTRLDTALFYVPPLLLCLVESPARLRTLRLLLLGAIPLVVWELFSVVYYGFPFPNTAYAKLGAGIPSGELLRQGLVYFNDSLERDPVTLVTVGLGLVWAAASRDRRLLAVAASIVLYLLYTLRIGGDFMTGRFFTLPLLAAVAIVSRATLLPDTWLALVPSAAVVWFGLATNNQASQLTSPIALPRIDPFFQAWRGIADERRTWFDATGLLSGTRVRTHPAHPNVDRGIALREAGTRVVTGGGGFMGYFGGPDLHVIDVAGLGDPLLARLPSIAEPGWRIGHFRRFEPAGYAETLRTGVNKIKDPRLAEYYDHLAVIVRGPIWSWDRFATIWKMNTGAYDDLIDQDAYHFTDRKEIALDALATRRKDGDPPDKTNATPVTEIGGRLTVTIGKVSHARRLELSCDADDLYDLQFWLAGKLVATRRTPPLGREGRGLQARTINIPAAATEAGFDELRLLPAGGNSTYAVGHLILLDDG